MRKDVDDDEREAAGFAMVVSSSPERA